MRYISRNHPESEFSNFLTDDTSKTDLHLGVESSQFEDLFLYYFVLNA